MWPYYCNGYTFVFCKAEVCKIYLVSLLIVAKCALVYVLADVYVEHQYYYKVNVYVVVTAVMAVIILALPIGVVKQPDYVYSYGAGVIATYIFVLTILLDNMDGLRGDEFIKYINSHK